MLEEVEIIQGGRHQDSRGTLDYVNGFDMSLVKRMYLITHPDPNIKRGWRGHKLEQRWFYVLEGSFEISLVKIDDWLMPSKDLSLETYTLSAEDPQIIYVPRGYASGFKALMPDSKFIVYADALIEQAQEDDYQYPVDYFNNWI